jgi:hypothetical protein
VLIKALYLAAAATLAVAGWASETEVTPEVERQRR